MNYEGVKLQTLFLYLFVQTIFKVKTEKPKTENFRGIQGLIQIRRRRRAARSLTSQGRAEPLCARVESANREVSEGKADL